MTIRFGEFRLDLLRRQLFRGRADVHLTPKAFELLTILVEARPRPQAKETLYARLWPSTFVSAANLSVLIAEVRAALGDTPGRADYIRTVQRFGYAFVAEATDDDPGRGAPFWLISSTIQVRLRDGDNLIGRDPAAVVFLDATQVSRQHARIRIVGHQVLLEDLQSKNGTFLRGEPVTGTLPLADGDEIRFGSSAVVTFRAGFDAGSTATETSKSVTSGKGRAR